MRASEKPINVFIFFVTVKEKYYKCCVTLTSHIYLERHCAVSFLCIKHRCRTKALGCKYKLKVTFRC